MPGALNHIISGAVFTGIFASIFDLNIFSKPEYVAEILLFSQLPDIDHTRSFVGKAFYPLARWLDRRFGHRTITHSLACYLGLWLLIYLVDPTGNIALIFALSYGSHLIFDMMTKQGVPLFYPFRRNPCVIPGNVDLRLKSGDLKTESVFFCLSVTMLFFCYPLMSNGFWTSYNKSFGTLKHLHSEFRRSKNLLQVEYTVSRLGEAHTGRGLLIEATESRAILWDSSRFVLLDDSYTVGKLDMSRTTRSARIQEEFFAGISPDSLTSLLTGKPILQLKLQSTASMHYRKDNKPVASASAELEHVFNPVFQFDQDSAKADLRNKLERLQYEKSAILGKTGRAWADYQAHARKLEHLRRRYDTADLSSRELIAREIRALEAKEPTKPETDARIGEIDLQIRHIQEQLAGTEKILVSGYVKYLIIK